MRRWLARSGVHAEGHPVARGGVAVHDNVDAAATWRARPNTGIGTGVRAFAPASALRDPTRPGPVVDPVLRRSAVPAAAGSESTVIRRTISKTSADIKAMRSKQGIRKGARTKDTLYALGKLLDKHHELVDQEKKGLVGQEKIAASLTAIVHLCDEYMLMHDRSRQKDRLIVVSDIGAEAHRDLGRMKAQSRYLNDLKAGATPRTRDPLKVEPTTTPMTQHLNDNVSYNAHQLSKNRGVEYQGGQGNPLNVVNAALREAGLTEAEIAAIKTFTASDYLYLNPAVGNDQKWLGQQLALIQGTMDLAHPGRKTDTRQLMHEGGAHAGVMMQGLAKLPPLQGKVYRGARMSPREFAETYGTQPTITYQTFVSSSTDPGPARNYATGHGSKPPRPDQTISVYAVFDCLDARDIKFLSEIKTENEWLLLPGTTFAIAKIEDDPDFSRTKGATSGKIVHLKQVPKPPKDGPPPPDRKFSG